MPRNKNDFLPYGYHCVQDDDIEAVAAALRGQYLTGGAAVADFENALAAVTGARYAVVAANGTAALHLSVLALGLGPGDAVIVPSVTFLATANAARYAGAEVVFADVDPETGLMTAETLRKATAAVPDGLALKAVMPVHFAGQVAAPMDVAEQARGLGLHIIEDACHALGTTYDENGIRHAVGACVHADMAVFSFHPVKAIAMGEGGAVTTNSEDLARKLRLFRNHGMEPTATASGISDEPVASLGERYPSHYKMEQPGYNYRASDINCALGVSQLRKLDRFSDKRRALAALYDAELAKISPHIKPLGRLTGCEPCWHLYVTLFDFDALGIKRSVLMAELKERGIGTQVHYYPVHCQPYYRHRYGDIDLPGATAYYRRCLTLPLFVDMDEDDVMRVVQTIKAIAA